MSASHSAINFADLPKEALHLVYRNLPPQKCVLLSQTCQQLRQAATTLPKKFKQEIVLILENRRFGATDFYCLFFIKASELLSSHKDEFERSYSSGKDRSHVEKLNYYVMKRRFTNSRAYIDVLKPLLKVVSLSQVRIVTDISDLFQLRWFKILRTVSGNTHSSAVPWASLEIEIKSVRSLCENISQVPISLHSSVEVVRHVSLVVILWNLARSGIRSVNLRYFFPLTVFSSIRLDWFSHLQLCFMAFPREVTRQYLAYFELFVKVFLEGGYKGSSFDFFFSVIGGKRTNEFTALFVTQLNKIRTALGQSERVCYHDSDTGVNLAWHTMSKGQYRISWQGPYIRKEVGQLFVRVAGRVDSDDAIPRTRPLTPALIRQMDSAFHTMGAA